MILRNFLGLMMQGLVPLLFINTLSSCNYFASDAEADGAVARVGEVYLHHSDLQHIFIPGMAETDSVELANSYINNWIRQQLLINEASNALTSDERLELDVKTADYRNSLITYLYEKKLVEEQLDTVMEEQELYEYYSEYPDNFELRDNVVRIRYIRLDPEAPKLDSARMWMRSGEDADIQRLSEYGFQYAYNFSVTDTSWLNAAYVERLLPIDENQLKELAAYRKYGEVEDATTLYLVYVVDYRSRGELAPFGYVKDNIQQIVLNKRKINYLNELYREIEEEGRRRNRFEVFP